MKSINAILAKLAEAETKDEDEKCFVFVWFYAIMRIL